MGDLTVVEILQVDKERLTFFFGLFLIVGRFSG
jgi:hypothetical protein